jgi:hypothetical protein
MEVNFEKEEAAVSLNFLNRDSRGENSTDRYPRERTLAIGKSGGEVGHSIELRLSG